MARLLPDPQASSSSSSNQQHNQQQQSTPLSREAALDACRRRHRGIDPTSQAALEASIRMFLMHIKHVWCAANEELGEYVLSWMASLVQHRASATGTLILLMGPPGAGKSIVLNSFLRPILGSDFCMQEQVMPAQGSPPPSSCSCTMTATGTPASASATATASTTATLAAWDDCQFGAVCNPSHPALNRIMVSNLDEPEVEVHYPPSPAGTNLRVLYLTLLNTRRALLSAETTADYFNALAAVPPEAVAVWLYTRDLSGWDPAAVPPSANCLTLPMNTT